MDDPCLPLENEAYIQTHSEALKDQMVSALMNTTSNSWDVDLVQDIFNSRDANIILSIPLDKTVNDAWYWRYEK